MKTTEGTKAFSLSLAISAGLLSVAGGIIGAIFGIVPGIVAGLTAGALLGFFGRSIVAFEFKKSAKPLAVQSRTEAATEIPLDRIDQLTGLANANGLAAWFEEKSARLKEDHKGIFVLLADLDKVDEIERIRGKETAEAVIKEVAKRVAGFVGTEGIAARTGNDEFVAVAAVVPANALQIAEESAGKLAETICRPVDLGGGTIWIGGAVGAAVGTADEGEGIMNRAKAALEKARQLGLGRFWVDGAS